MLYTIIMLDKPDAEELREKTRDRHLEYMKSNFEGIRLGGPLMSEDGSRMIGSMVVKEFASRSEAEAFIKNEPYNHAGLFETVLIRPFQPVVDQKISE